MGVTSICFSLGKIGMGACHGWGFYRAHGWGFAMEGYSLEKWQNPIRLPGQNPIHVPRQNLIHVPGQTPIHVPGQTPIHVPGQNPIHDRRPFLFCPGAKHRGRTHATPTSQPLSGITPPPFTFAPALARAYAWANARAKAGTFLKVFDGNTLP